MEAGAQSSAGILATSVVISDGGLRYRCTTPALTAAVPSKILRKLSAHIKSWRNLIVNCLEDTAHSRKYCLPKQNNFELSNSNGSRRETKHEGLLPISPAV